jgi:hypothetical protein
MGIKCPRCRIGAARKPLYRSNPKGIEGVWFCFEHLPEEFKEEAMKVRDLTELIHKEKKDDD